MKNIFLKNQNPNGFTLIELLVATTIFTIIAVGGISILLSAQRAYKRLSENRIAVDNINLVLNNMSREIKFGTDYLCLSGNTTDFITDSGHYNSFSTSTVVSSSNFCNAISFTPQDSTTTKIVYFLDKTEFSINEADYNYNFSSGNFDRAKDIRMTSSDFSINDFNTFISGTDISVTGDNDNLQPKVKILISGLIATNRNNQTGTTATSSFTVQQVVSQRTLDN